MAATLCVICTGIFAGGHTLEQEQPHHGSSEDFLAAARNGCYICRTITTSPGWNSVKAQELYQQAMWYLCPLQGSAPGCLRLSIDCVADEDEAEPSSGSESRSGSIPDGGIDEYKPLSPAWGFILEPVDGKDIRYVTNIDMPFVYLYDKEQTAYHSYAAFSHCWGKAKTVKLLEANMQVLLQGMPVLDLPLSYREAILVCQALDISYIWIDSLCIIQDSIDDWTREAAMMQHVYQNSILNICASAAAESSEASFQCRDTSLIMPLDVDVLSKSAETRRYQLVSSEHIENDIASSPLRSRAWVYQEDVLSKRSLSLTRGQLWWECRHTIACETYPLGIPFHLLPENQAARLRARKELSHHSQASGSSSSDDEINRKFWRWYNSIADYSECGLTQPTDKLIALSGVAQSYRDLNRLQDEDYLAGCWKSQLPYALCWETIRLKRTYRPPVYIAPSWSWASIEGALYYSFSAEEMERASTKSLCQIKDIKLHHLHAHYKTGPLRGGCIQVHGHIIGPITEEFEYMAEDDEIQHALQTAHWGFDEVSVSGYRVATYLDQLEPDLCQDGLVDGPSRKSVLQSDEAPQLSLLPIFQRLVDCCEECETSIHGLILGQIEGQPGNVFHRFGSFDYVQMSSGILARVPSRDVVLI